MERVTIGRALVHRRHALGLNTERAAAVIGVSRATYAAYERDARRLSVDSLRDFLPFLDVTDDEIVELYGATCVVQARMALLRDALREDDSSLAHASARTVPDVVDNDLAVVKRVYFDPVDGDFEPAESAEPVGGARAARVAKPLARHSDDSPEVRGGVTPLGAVTTEPRKIKGESGKKSKKKSKKTSKGQSEKTSKRKKLDDAVRHDLSHRLHDSGDARKRSRGKKAKPVVVEVVAAEASKFAKHSRS